MPDPSRGRQQTDASLRTERGKTDRELERRRAHVESSADAVVLRARTAADEVLKVARDAADEKIEEHHPAVTQERTAADQTLQGERAVADATVLREREERRRALANLLRLEREDTDQHLLTERGSSDQALNTRDIFLAMVSHDLKTLLGGIAMTAEVLAQEALGTRDLGAAVRTRTETIQRLTARMNRLIGDLVDVASIETGKFLVAPTKGDLLGVLREAAEVFHASVDAREIQLVARLDGPPLLVPFDHERILQVLANLFSNAIKFSERGARITIRVEETPGELRVAVTDTGPGIAPENIEAIFGKFWQVGRRDRKGLGLGLYISRCILEAHQGRIWAESRQGAGSTFWFALPRR